MPIRFAILISALAARLLDHQFALQDEHYRRHYPNAERLVIERQGTPVGRILVEVSRALGTPSDEVKKMLEAYEEYYEVAQTALRTGATAHDVHRAVSAG